jgi:hypothetical protein
LLLLNEDYLMSKHNIHHPLEIFNRNTYLLHAELSNAPKLTKYPINTIVILIIQYQQ